MEEETSSADAACSVAPWDICWEEELVWALPEADVIRCCLDIVHYFGELPYHRG